MNAPAVSFVNHVGFAISQSNNENVVPALHMAMPMSVLGVNPDPATVTVWPSAKPVVGVTVTGGLGGGSAAGSKPSGLLGHA